MKVKKAILPILMSTMFAAPIAVPTMSYADQQVTQEQQNSFDGTDDHLYVNYHGKMVKHGTQNKNGNTYYFYYGKMVKNNFENVNGYWAFFNNEGHMLKNKKLEYNAYGHEHTYYFNNEGHIIKDDEVDHDAYGPTNTYTFTNEGFSKK
nr:hypothetical protein [Bacillus cereus]